MTGPDGTTTTTVTEVRTESRDGHTVTTRSTSTRSGGTGTAAAVPSAPAARPGAAESPGDRVRKAALPGSDLSQEALAAHNQVRARVGAPPLSWNEDLARQAEEWAEHLCNHGRRARGLQHRRAAPSQCTQADLRQAAITMKLRPPRCMHGGHTRAAV